MTPSERLIGVIGVSVAASVGLAVAAFKSGIQRRNGVRSATSWMNQTLRVASQRAPSALVESFSAKGVTTLILMGGIITLPV